MEPVEDITDLSCEPSEQATLMPPFIGPQSIDLLGLQFMPIASDEEVDSLGAYEYRMDNRLFERIQLAT